MGKDSNGIGQLIYLILKTKLTANLHNWFAPNNYLITLEFISHDLFAHTQAHYTHIYLYIYICNFGLVSPFYFSVGIFSQFFTLSFSFISSLPKSQGFIFIALTLYCYQNNSFLSEDFSYISRFLLQRHKCRHYKHFYLFDFVSLLLTFSFISLLHMFPFEILFLFLFYFFVLAFVVCVYINKLKFSTDYSI